MLLLLELMSCFRSFQENGLQSIGNERASFRSLKKNIGGRWKRLVKKKPEQEVYTIPPELKPQLKQIYVYWPLIIPLDLNEAGYFN